MYVYIGIIPTECGHCALLGLYYVEHSNTSIPLTNQITPTRGPRHPQIDP